MSDVAFERLVLTSSVGLGLIVWGVLTTLFAPRRWATQASVVVSSVAVLSPGIVVFTPQWWPVILGAVMVGLIGVDPIRTRVIALLRPRVAGVAVAILAAGGTAYEGWQYDRTIDAESEAAFKTATEEMPAVTKDAAIQVKTDRGTILVLSDAVDPRSRVEADERERTSPALNNYLGRWIRRGPADDQSNCHGWVFAAGQYNLAGRHVNTILFENGYLEVSDPNPGDVCVYRNQQGEVLHTGLVRGVLDDCTVMVEGKWGRLGVYLHAVGDSCYGTIFTYHRTDRAGHTLVGLDPSTEPKITASPASVATPGP